jgi:hypothetical protein
MQAILRRPLWLALALLIPAPGAPGHAAANEIDAGLHPAGLVVHDASETLRDYCASDDSGRLWLVLPGGTRFELVTSTADPSIPNPGDGAFHPFDPAEVRGALAAIRFPLDRLRADIFLLPYPRRGALESAAGPGLVLLSPGVIEISREHQHAELVHEIGHVVHYEFLPEADVAGWTAYRRLRGIEDPLRYSASSVHCERPHEIFAEDFRYLMGGALANYSGSIENAALPTPDAVAGLEPFLMDLSGEAAVQPAIAVSPNPARGALVLSRGGISAAPLDLFDAAGRRLATLSAEPSGATTRWRWNGRDLSGRRAGPGVVFARVRGERGAGARVTLLP